MRKALFLRIPTILRCDENLNYERRLSVTAVVDAYSRKRRVAILLHPNTKVLDFQGLFVFLGVKNTPLSPLYLFPDLMDLNL